VTALSAAGTAGALACGSSDSSSASNSGHSSNSSESPSAQGARLVRTARGDLGRFVDRFVAALNKRRVYVKPTPRQAKLLSETYRAMRAGKLSRAAILARGLGYEVVRFRDRATHRTFLMLLERRKPRRGWGLYIHAPRSRSKLIVEVPHPHSDIKSEKVGVGVFRRANAADLFVAGSHRRAAADKSSDAAHNESGPFEAVHRGALKPGAVVLQPHGFDEGERSARYGEIVVSSGEEPTSLATSVAEKLKASGFPTCLYGPGHCEGLGATTNVEGASTRAAGALFIHVELALRLRERNSLRARIVSTLANALS
jgi:hypothetical protein